MTRTEQALADSAAQQEQISAGVAANMKRAVLMFCLVIGGAFMFMASGCPSIAGLLIFGAPLVEAVRLQLSK